MLKTEYKVGDIVWSRDAKQTWWPARVMFLPSKDNKSVYGIRLIGRKFDQKRTYNQLSHFINEDEKNGKTKYSFRQNPTPEFLCAISAACRIQDGSSTFEGNFELY